jgi:hypothetical protein
MHDHTDHLDAQTLRPILASNPKTKLVIPEANRAFVAARLAKAASGRPVVACRFDMFGFNTRAPAAFCRGMRPVSVSRCHPGKWSASDPGAANLKESVDLRCAPS